MPGTTVHERGNADVPNTPDEARPRTRLAYIGFDHVDDNKAPNGSLPAENRPANVYVFWIIRVK